MNIKIIIIGKVKEKIYQKRILEYIKWIKLDFQTEIIILKDSNTKKLDQKLSSYIKSRGHTICVTEEGSKLSSKQFSKFIFDTNQNLTFFIGGPNGHSEIVRKGANSILSLSNMTLPHEMALLVLTEQIFRAISIQKGSKYHRE